MNTNVQSQCLKGIDNLEGLRTAFREWVW